MDIHTELVDATAELRQIFGAFDVHPRSARRAFTPRSGTGGHVPFAAVASTSRQQQQPPQKLRAVAPRPPSIVDRMRWERRDVKEREAAAVAVVAAAQREVRVQRLGRGDFRFSQTRPAELAQLETSPLPAARGFAPVVIKGIPPSNAELLPRRVRARPLPAGGGGEADDRGTHCYHDCGSGGGGAQQATTAAETGYRGGVQGLEPASWERGALPPIHVHIAMPPDLTSSREHVVSTKHDKPALRRAATITAIPIASAAVPVRARPQLARHPGVVVAVPVMDTRPAPSFPQDSGSASRQEDHAGEAT